MVYLHRVSWILPVIGTSERTAFKGENIKEKSEWEEEEEGGAGAEWEEEEEGGAGAECPGKN